MPIGSARTPVPPIHPVLLHFRPVTEPTMVAIMKRGIAPIGGLLRNFGIMKLAGVGGLTTILIVSRS